MNNDAVRLLELILEVNKLVAKHGSMLQLGTTKLRPTVLGVCLLCDLERDVLKNRKVNLEEQGFWSELWILLKPHVDVDRVKEYYGNLEALSCQGWTGEDLLQKVAEHFCEVSIAK